MQSNTAISGRCERDTFPLSSWRLDGPPASTTTASHLQCAAIHRCSGTRAPGQTPQFPPFHPFLSGLEWSELDLASRPARRRMGLWVSRAMLGLVQRVRLLKAATAALG